MAERVVNQARQFAVQLRRGTSTSGLGIALAVACVAGSGFPELRPQVAGLMLHPYLLVLAMLTPVTLMRLHRMDRRVALFGGLFVAAASVLVLAEGRVPGEIAKLAISGLTVFAIAVNLRTEEDFRIAVLVLPLAISVIALGTLIRGDESLGSISGARFMRGVGNKNAFSLYALPAILIGGYVFTDRALPMLARFVVGAATLFLTGTLFLSANRSGWLGVFVVAAMLALVRLNLRTALLVAGGSLVIGMVATRGGSSEMIELRVEQTSRGYSADTLRQDLFVHSVEIGVESPLFGVGPDHLIRELARKERAASPILDPHNVVAYLVGAFGFPTTALFFCFIASLWWVGGRRAQQDARGKEAVDLVRMVVVLFMVRGMFTREVLYMPAMAMALGLALGRHAVARTAAKARASRRRVGLRSREGGRERSLAGAVA